MYSQEFSDFKNRFLNDPEVGELILKLKEKFEDGFKKHILDQLDEEEVYESIETIYSLMWNDMKPDEYTIFDIFLFQQE